MTLFRKDLPSFIVDLKNTVVAQWMKSLDLKKEPNHNPDIQSPQKREHMSHSPVNIRWAKVINPHIRN